MHFTPLRLPLYFVKLVPVISLHVCSFSRSVSSLEWSLLQVPSRSLDALWSQLFVLTLLPWRLTPLPTEDIACHDPQPSMFVFWSHAILLLRQHRFIDSLLLMVVQCTIRLEDG